MDTIVIVIVTLVLRYIVGKITLFVFGREWNSKEWNLNGFIPMISAIILAFMVGFQFLGRESLIIMAVIEGLIFFILGRETRGRYINLRFSLIDNVLR